MIWKRSKKFFSRYIPTHIGNPFGLVRRMLRSGNRAAFFTLWSAALAMILIPIDLVLSIFETHLAKRITDGNGRREMIFVCGPARSGTTIVYQYLTAVLDTSYIPNYTYLFPRSPILITKLFGTKQNTGPQELVFDNYFGKTKGMRGPNEANHVWGRWLRADKSGWLTQLSRERAAEMATFFRAFAGLASNVFINKCNNMNVFADKISQVLPDAFIICMSRDRRFLAQSLIKARREMHGDTEVSYGARKDDSINRIDPVKDVCEQVRYMKRLEIAMQESIGAEKFIVLSYEDFCRSPGRIIKQLLTSVPGLQFRDGMTIDDLPPLNSTNFVSDSMQMAAIEKCFLEDSLSDSLLDPIGSGANSRPDQLG